MAIKFRKWGEIRNFKIFKIVGDKTSTIVEKMYSEDEPNKLLDFVYRYEDYKKGLVDSLRHAHLEENNFNNPVVYAVNISENIFDEYDWPLIPLAHLGGK